MFPKLKVFIKTFRHGSGVGMCIKSEGRYSETPFKVCLGDKLFVP
jgi:hypothetical protein